MSRFLPAVLTLKTLQNMGITLEDDATRCAAVWLRFAACEKGQKIHDLQPHR